MKEKLLLELKRQAVLYGADEAGDVYWNGNGHGRYQRPAAYKLAEIYKNVTGEDQTALMMVHYEKGYWLANKGIKRAQKARDNTSMREVDKYLKELI